MRNVIMQPVKVLKYFRSKQRPYKRIEFIVDSKDWSIYWDGKYITDNVRSNFGLQTAIRDSTESIYYSVIHFGSMPTFTSPHPSNRVVVTFFHGKEADPSPNISKLIKGFKERVHLMDKVVTACSMMEERLLDWGVPANKLEKIPLGVDTTLFVPSKIKNKNRIKQELGIPENAICIASFQKDGNGWGEGLEPKLIKGPDIFVEAVTGIAQKNNIFVLLTGPARGYVKKNLKQNGIPYKHVYLKDYREIVKYYHATDLYLVTSREEGGPKAVLESMATGVPLISTHVGMAPDVIINGENGFLVDVEDVDGLIACASELIKKQDLRQKFCENGLNTVPQYHWSNIAKQYYEKAYRPLLNL